MVRIGIIGTGFMGRTHAAGYGQCAEVESVRLLAEPSMREQAEALAAGCPKVTTIDTDPDRFFASDIQGVDICTPTPLHAELVRRAIGARKAILCEKPLTLDPVSSRELVKEARQAGVPFMVAQVIRFWPEYERLKEVVDRGSCGPLRALSLERYSPLPMWGNWFANLQISGGALFDLHIHDIDFLQYLLGAPRRLSALGRKQDGAAYLDIRTTLEFAGGVRVSVYGSYDHPRATPFRMAYRALFEKGCLDYDIWRTPTLKRTDDASEQAVDLAGMRDGYTAECTYFAECLAQGKEPERSSAESATRTIELLEKIGQSADQGGRWIELD